jgi:hypothetical protein
MCLLILVLAKAWLIRVTCVHFYAPLENSSLKILSECQRLQPSAIEEKTELTF